MFQAKLADAISAVKDAIENYLNEYKVNATYKTKPELKDYIALPIVRGFVHALATMQRVYFVGEAGIGKTSFIKAVCRALGIDLIVINAANLSIENLFVPFPKDHEEWGTKVIEALFYKRLTTDSKKVIFIDEIGRADAGLANTLMELLQEGTLAGKEIQGLITVVAADNPQGVYGKMSGLDFSQADRFATVVLDSKSTPWRRALAEEFPTIDLNKVFSVYDTLDGDVRRIINPRVLSFTIRVMTEGLPGIWSIPVVSGIKMQLINKGGIDVTDETLDKIASALGTTNRETIADPVGKAVDFAVKFKQNIRIIGAPGIGKTSSIKAALKNSGINYHYDSAAVLQPEDLTIPFPSADGKSLDLVPMEKFADPNDWVWIVDEISRGSRRTQNAIMEPIQERTIGGEPTGIVCTIALDNPREVAGFKLDVGRNDLAQASRFAITLQINASDIASAKYLRDQFGDEIATPFIEWWEDDLDDIGRVLCTPRCLERMIKLYESGNELIWALPFVNGEYVKVPLVELHARLDKRPLARLRQIVANADEYADLLGKGKDEEAMAHATVFMAFYKADVAQLDEVRDICVRLYKVLDRQHRIDLIRQGGERQKFWNSVLTESK